MSSANPKLALAVLLAFCATASMAERPSVAILLVELNKLKAEVASLNERLALRGPVQIVVDANGNTLGPIADVYWEEETVFGVNVGFSVHGYDFFIRTLHSGFEYRPVRWDDWDCQGTSYGEVQDNWPDQFPGMLQIADIGGGVAYVPDIKNFSGTRQTNFTIRSELLPNGDCINQSGTGVGSGVPSVPVLDVSGFVPPFTITFTE